MLRRRRRNHALVLLPLVISLGLASRRWPIGFALYDDALGDALYAVMVYLVLTIAVPAQRPFALAIVAATLCLAIELFKLTGLPRTWQSSALSRLLFGTTFGWHNLVRYAGGILCVALLDELYHLRTCRRP